VILTQTYRDIGSPSDYIPVGVYVDEVDLTNGQGHGLDYNAHIIELQKRADCKLILNAVFTSLRTNAHASYGRLRIRVTGDSYAKVPNG